jgi:hypothetical protein
MLSRLSPMNNNVENFYYDHLDEEYLLDAQQFLGPFFQKREYIEQFVTMISTYLNRQESRMPEANRKEPSVAETIELIIGRLTQQEKTRTLFTRDTLVLLAWTITIRELILKEKVPLSSNAFMTTFPTISQQNMAADELLYLMRFERAIKYFKSAKLDFNKNKDLILRVAQYFEWNQRYFKSSRQNPAVVDMIRTHIFYYYENLRVPNTNKYLSPTISQPFPNALPSISSFQLPSTPPYKPIPSSLPYMNGTETTITSSSFSTSKVEFLPWRNGGAAHLVYHFSDYLDQIHSLQEVDEFSERFFKLCWHN